MSHSGGHGYPRTQQIRVERRARAEKDQHEYNQKYPTLQAKLDALPPTGSKKQRARLEAAIEAEKKKVEAAKTASHQVAVQKAEKSQTKKGKNQ
jgi:hypothetical protein